MGFESFGDPAGLGFLKGRSGISPNETAEAKSGSAGLKS